MSSRAWASFLPWRRSKGDEHNSGLSGLEKSLGSSVLGLLSLGERSSGHTHTSDYIHTWDHGPEWKGTIMHEGLQGNFSCPAPSPWDAHKASGPVLQLLHLLIPPQTSCPALPHPQSRTCMSKKPSEEIKFDKSTLCWAKKRSDEKHEEKQNLTVAVFHGSIGPLGSFYCKFTTTPKRSGIVPALVFSPASKEPNHVLLQN